MTEKQITVRPISTGSTITVKGDGTVHITGWDLTASTPIHMSDLVVAVCEHALAAAKKQAQRHKDEK